MSITGSTGCIGTPVYSGVPILPLNGKTGGATGPSLSPRTPADVTEMLRLLADWISSGELGPYDVRELGQYHFCFSHQLKQTGSLAVPMWELKLDTELNAELWYIRECIRKWDLHEPSSLAEFEYILSRYGRIGTDPRTSIRTWDSHRGDSSQERHSNSSN